MILSRESYSLQVLTEIASFMSYFEAPLSIIHVSSLGVIDPESAENGTYSSIYSSLVNIFRGIYSSSSYSAR